MGPPQKQYHVNMIWKEYPIYNLQYYRPIHMSYMLGRMTDGYQNVDSIDRIKHVECASSRATPVHTSSQGGLQDFLFPNFSHGVNREFQGVGREREQGGLTRVSLSFAHYTISLNLQGLENAPRRCVWWLHTYMYLVYQNNRELLLVLCRLPPIVPNKGAWTTNGEVPFACSLTS